MTGPVQATSNDDVYSTVVRAIAARGIDVDNLVEGVDADELAGEPWLRAVVDAARERMRADIVTALRRASFEKSADLIEAKVIAP